MQTIADMKDENTVMRKSVWVDNRNITECQKCRKPFSVERRRVCDGRERSWSEGVVMGGRGAGVMSIAN